MVNIILYKCAMVSLNLYLWKIWTNRYLLTFLHLVKNENTPPKESPEYKLYKLESSPETLSNTYQKYYTDEREVAIDGQMVGMKCRTSIIQ